jgi:mono/diheme cytochrome c family protein
LPAFVLLSAIPPVLAQDSSDVAKVIVPFVQKHCGQCHGEKEPKGDVSLSVFKDDGAIWKARTTWNHVLDQLGGGLMPPQGKTKPTPEEAERFTVAVRNLFERLDRTAPRDPGLVTMRRLNRVEYVNTVRDLLGVAIPLGGDFPSDNVGYGFDNIGDVLALSPLQFERYLATAEAITNAAIVVGELPPPPQQFHHGTEFNLLGPMPPRVDNSGRLARDPKGKDIPPINRFPPLPDRINPRGTHTKIPLQMVFQDVNTPGQFQIVSKLVGSSAGGEPSKFAVTVNGKEVLRGDCQESATDHAATVHLNPGPLRVEVSLLNEFTDPEDEAKRRIVVVISCTLVGPIVTDSHELLFAGSEKLAGDAKTRFVLERFASRAFRRPATAPEVDRLVQIVQQAEQIPWFKLTEDSLKKLREAKVPDGVIGKLRNRSGPGNVLKSMLEIGLCDEEQFVKSLRERLVDKGKPDETHVPAILQAAEQAPQPWEARIAVAVRAVLCSPKFLYRAELDSRPHQPAAQARDSQDNDAPSLALRANESQPIDDYQLASRLSYFLWSTMPDQELFDLAAKKQLHQNLPAQVKRMIADPRSKTLFDNFAMQWLRLRPLREFSPDAKLFPEFSRELRDDMLMETELFFLATLREDRSIFDLIDGKFTFLNERLAKLYDIADTNGNSSLPKAALINPKGEPIPKITGGHADHGLPTRSFLKHLQHNPFVRVNLTNTPRGGLLTQASVLAVTSHPTRTSPVKRGHWVLEQILGTPPPPPPPNVPELAAKDTLQPTTLRQQLEQHRANPSCAGCHARMDPIGFAFENFDVLGKFRDKEGDLPIDPSGELPSGQKFKGPDELKAILKEKKELFSRNLTERMLIYATGRGLDYFDRRSVDGILAEAKKNDHRFHALITAIVQSDPFRMRRGNEERPLNEKEKR